jgi:translation initiation factor 1 (eIF-1/SUI1)
MTYNLNLSQSSDNNDDDNDDNNNNNDNDNNNNNNNDDNNEQNSCDVLSQIDRKLTLKYQKDGKYSKTYVIGLDKYFDETKQNEIIKNLKKKLGTFCTKNNIDNSSIYSFGGDHINILYDYFSKIIPKHEIKKQ